MAVSGSALPPGLRPSLIISTVCAAEWRDIASNAPSFDQNVFSLSPVVLIGYVLFAVALGLCLAVVFLPAGAGACPGWPGFIGMRVFTAFFLRERYHDPEEETLASAYGIPDRERLDRGRVLAEQYRRAPVVGRFPSSCVRGMLPMSPAACHTSPVSPTTDCTTGGRIILATESINSRRSRQPSISASPPDCSSAYWWLTQRSA